MFSKYNFTIFDTLHHGVGGVLNLTVHVGQRDLNNLFLVVNWASSEVYKLEHAVPLKPK